MRTPRKTRSGRWIAITLLSGLLAAPASISPAVASAPMPSPGPQQPTDINDIWLYDRADESLSRLTVATGRGRESTAAAMSADGNRIVFHSDDDLQGDGVPDGTDEIWLYEVSEGKLTRVTSASDPSRDSRNPAINADGTRIVFESDSDFLDEGLPSGQREIWLYTVGTGEMRRLTHATAPGTGSATPDISADGGTVAFSSSAIFGGEGGSEDIWLADVDSGELARVTYGRGRGRSLSPDLNADGTWLAFESDADLLDQGLPRGQREIWRYGVAGRSLERLTDGRDPSRASEQPSISADGNRIAFYSDADLLGEGRPDSVDEVWLYDVGTSSLRRVTSIWVPERDAGSNAVTHPDAANVSITADGNAILFASDADLLGEGLAPGHPHAWIYDLQTDTLHRIDTSTGSGSGIAVNADASRLALYRTPFDVMRLMRVSAASAPPPPETLTAAAISADLDALRVELEGRWAYLRANDVDYVAAIEEIRARSAAGMDYDAYGIEIQKLISRFIDGHSGVGGFRYPPGGLPFLIEAAGDRYVGFHADRSGFLMPGFPFVRTIDGVEVDGWIEAARPFNPQGSKQYVVRRGLRQLSALQFLRGELSLPLAETVRVELASADGTRRTEVHLPAGERSPSGSTWPRHASGFVDGDVGYIRIASMTPEAATDIDAWMARFQDTRGLVVDVRGNGGGLRHPLRALYPYLVDDSAQPRIANVAKYRLHPDNAEDHLGGSRFLYRETWAGWTPAERQAIEQFKETFTAEWQPPEEEFSEWHYLVLARHNNPNAYVYGKPVIVLMDEKCFSATDIFLAGLKGVPSVTLLGTPSGGGSARSVGTRLPESGLSLRLASMASFQPNGLLYDGNGVHPDIVVEPTPDYFLRGGADNVLEAALDLLRQRP